MASGKNPKWLFPGDKGPEVEKLCELLSLHFFHLKKSNMIKSRTKYDPDLESIVQRYQGGNVLVCDGIVDDATWNALLGKDKLIDYRFQVMPQSQKTYSTCWKAATAMIYNINQSAVTTGKANYDKDKFISTDQSNLDLYAKEHGLNRERSIRASPSAISSLLSLHGALMLEAKAEIIGGAGGADMHFMVLVALRTDGVAGNSTCTCWDPWPPNSLIGSERTLKFSELFGLVRSVFYKNNIGKQFRPSETQKAILEPLGTGA